MSDFPEFFLFVGSPPRPAGNEFEAGSDFSEREFEYKVDGGKWPHRKHRSYNKGVQNDSGSGRELTRCVWSWFTVLCSFRLGGWSPKIDWQKNLFFSSSIRSCLSIFPAYESSHPGSTRVGEDDNRQTAGTVLSTAPHQHDQGYRGDHRTYGRYDS